MKSINLEILYSTVEHCRKLFFSLSEARTDLLFQPSIYGDKQQLNCLVCQERLGVGLDVGAVV